jgi:hypothetical protein
VIKKAFMPTIIFELTNDAKLATIAKFVINSKHLKNSTFSFAATNT